MRRRTQNACNLLLAIFLYGQVNAAVHFVVVEHDFCPEHATATPRDHEDQNSKDKDREHEEHEDCPVMAQLTRLAAETPPDSVDIGVSDVFVAFARTQDNLVHINLSDLFLLSPSNSPPLLALFS